MPDKSYAKQVVEARTGRDLSELLRELYITRRWTDQEIADSLKVARTTVVLWRQDFGIDRSQRQAVLERPEAIA